MGLFDFAADLGKKLFGDKDDPSEKIQQHIESDNPGVEGLEIKVEEGVAKVSGKAKDQSVNNRGRTILTQKNGKTWCVPECSRPNVQAESDNRPNRAFSAGSANP